VVARFKDREIRASELGLEVQRHFPDVAAATLTRLIGMHVAVLEAEQAGIRLPDEYLKERATSLQGDLTREAAVAYGAGTRAEDYVERRFRRGLEEHLAVLLEQERYTWLMNRVVRLHTLQTNRAELDVIVVRSRDLALEIAKKLDQGAEFARLATAHSVHSSARRGGRLDPLPREALHPAAASRAFELQPGERTGVLEVKGEGGGTQFEILRLVRHLPARSVTWEEAREEIERALAKQPVSRAEWSAWFLRLEKLYKVSLSGSL
jgi:parvulin-like peptidyl-prolyl isomerase